MQKQAVYERLFLQSELECVFHRVSLLNSQAASIYLPIGFQCASSFLKSSGKPSIGKGVIKACLPLLGWVRARDVNVSAPAVVDASSCWITVLFSHQWKHQWSAAVITAQQHKCSVWMHTWPRVVWKFMSNLLTIGFYECMAKNVNSLKVTFTPVSGSKQDPTLNSVQANSIFK